MWLWPWHILVLTQYFGFFSLIFVVCLIWLYVSNKLWLGRIFVGYGAVIAWDVAVFAELICYGAGDDFGF